MTTRGPYDPSETAQVYTAPLALDEDTLDREHSGIPEPRCEHGLPPLDCSLCAMRTNTYCPKFGAAQWTCTKDECTCHLKESIGVIKVGPIR